MEFNKMKEIKFGLKLWSTDYGLIAQAPKAALENIFQYIELMVVPGTEAFYFKKINIPFILHATSENWGFNIADSQKEKNNLGIIKNCLAWADELKALYIIVHPGFGEFASVKFFLDKINDRRILIENMPKVGINNEKMVGYCPEQIKELKTDKFGFCLDLNHAAKAALSLEKDYKEFIGEFAKLNPEIFHISDGDFKKESDEHLNIGAGDFDFAFFWDCIKKSGTAYITLETPRTDNDSLQDDLANLEIIKTLFNRQNTPNQ
jgi:endonuclease IV